VEGVLVEEDGKLVVLVVELERAQDTLVEEVEAELVAGAEEDHVRLLHAAVVQPHAVRLELGDGAAARPDFA